MRFFTLLIVALLVSSAYASKRMNNIVGGVPANTNQFPFMVSLDICGSSCGGFLLSATHVGTAAHCFGVNASASCITAQAGTKDVSSSANGQIRNASSFNVNSNYNPTTLQFDAAVITLSSPFNVDNTAVRIAPLETNSSNLPLPNATVYVAGWGDTQTGGPASPSSLLVVDLPYFNFTNCNTTYNGSLASGIQICAGGQAGKDSCQGDSGGPLFTTANLIDPIDAKIIGIVSFGGQNCAITGTPGVYSDVPGFANAFFQQVIGLSASVAASSVLPSSAAPSSIAASSVALTSVAPSVAASVAASSVAGSVAASSVAAGSVAASSVAGSVAASSVAGGSSGAVPASSGAVAASSGAVAASSGAVAASSGVVAASSGVVAASSGVVAASSVVVAASSGVTKSQSATSSGSPPESSGAVAASSVVVAASSGVASATKSKVISVKTKTGLAAITCRQTCQVTFRNCKKTTRRIRTCKRAKKVCVAGCGVVNPN
jgi:trypsin